MIRVWSAGTIRVWMMAAALAAGVGSTIDRGSVRAAGAISPLCRHTPQLTRT